MFYMCQSVYLARCILQQHFLPMSAFNVTDTVTFTASALKLALTHWKKEGKIFVLSLQENLQNTLTMADGL